jgi:hypothetical protein
VLSDYSDVLNVVHDNPQPITDLSVGELVTVGISKHPVWRVLAVHGHRAWIARTDRPEVDGLGEIVRFRRAIHAVEQAA